MTAAVPSPAFRERLHVPLRWWVQSTMLVATLWLALVVAVPGVIAWGATAVALLLEAVLLRSYGAPVIEVADGELRAGRAHIAARHLGPVTPLDAEQSRRIAGPEADARAYLLLRPYLRRAVRVEITDPVDPAPYWLMSTRHPDRLAAAAVAIRDGGPRGSRSEG